MRGDPTPARAGLFPLGLFLLIVVVGAVLGDRESSARTLVETPAGFAAPALSVGQN